MQRSVVAPGRLGSDSTTFVKQITSVWKWDSSCLSYHMSFLCDSCFSQFQTLGNWDSLTFLIYWIHGWLILWNNFYKVNTINFLFKQRGFTMSCCCFIRLTSSLNDGFNKQISSSLGWNKMLNIHVCLYMLLSCDYKSNVIFHISNLENRIIFGNNQPSWLF